MSAPFSEFWAAIRRAPTVRMSGLTLFATTDGAAVLVRHIPGTAGFEFTQAGLA